MKRFLLLVTIWLVLPLCVQADPPVITGFGNGEVVWTNTTGTGYCTVEWAPAVTGSWARSWQGLFDIPSVVGETRRQVPMFYRVSWSTSNSVPIVRPPEVTSFTATAADGAVGLSWTNPNSTNFAGVRVVRNPVWYPGDETDGTTVYNGSGNSALDSGLANGTRYYYKAFSVNPVGVYSVGSTASALPSDATPPPNVQGFAAVAGDHQVQLVWQNPGSADFSGVKIMRNAGTPPTGPTSGTMVYSGLATNATDTGLVNGTFYYYRGYSFDNTPNYSAGVPATAQPLNLLPPDNVINPTAQPGDTLVILRWTNPAGGDFLGVRIQRKTGAAPTNAVDGVLVYQGAAQSFTNTGLTNGLVYYYGLFSYDEVPNYSSGIGVNGAPADTNPPASISNLVATAVPGAIALAWRNPADNDLAGVIIKKKTTGYPASSSDGTTLYDGTGTNATDAPLTDAWTTNFYRAFGYDEVPNYSTGSNVVYASLPNVTGFSAAPRDQAAILRWTNPVSANFAGVTIQQSTNTAPTNALDGTTVYIGMGTVFTNAPLTNTVRYYYAAFTFDATPNYSSGAFTNAIPADTNAPGSVTSVVSDASNGTVFLSWVNAGDVDLAGVRIQRKTGTSPTNYADGVTVFDGLATSFTDTGLTNGTNYCYRLFAHDEVPNYAAGITTTSMPLRVLFVEDFEDGGGWTDHTNRTWSQSSASGVWVATGYFADEGFYAMTNVAYAHSGQRWLRSVVSGGYGYCALPPSDNPCEVRAWARAPGFATSGRLYLQYYDGFTWYDFSSVLVTGDTYVNAVFRPMLNGHAAQQLRFRTMDALYIDDVEIRVAP